MQVVVLLRGRDADEEVLEVVGERPAALSACRKRHLAGRLVLVRDYKQLVQRLRLGDAQGLERRGLVPEGALGVGLPYKTVERAIECAQVGVTFVKGRVEGCARHEGIDLDQGACSGKLRHLAGAGFERDVGRTAAGDARAQERAHVIATHRFELDGDTRLGGKGIHDRQESVTLAAAPGRGYRNGFADGGLGGRRGRRHGRHNLNLYHGRHCLNDRRRGLNNRRRGYDDRLRRWRAGRMRTLPGRGR